MIVGFKTGFVKQITTFYMEYVSSQKKKTMSNHEEPQQDEVGGPVTIALFVFAIVILSIYFIAS